MSVGVLVLGMVAAGLDWSQEPVIHTARASETEGSVSLTLGEKKIDLRLAVEVRDSDDRLVFRGEVPASMMTTARWNRRSVGPWVVSMTLVDREGRRSPTRTLVTDVDWWGDDLQGCSRIAEPVQICGVNTESPEEHQFRAMATCPPGETCALDGRHHALWDGAIMTRNGPGARVLLRMGTVNADWVDITVESGLDRPAQLTGSIPYAIMGCVDCRVLTDLPADRDLVLRLQLFANYGQPSEPRRILVHTPSRLYGRNGNAADDCWHPAIDLDRPAPPTPPPWPLRVLLFGVLPFLAGYALQTLRRKMSWPSSPCSARRKPKRRKSAIG